MTLSLQHKSTLGKCIKEHLQEVQLDNQYKCDKCHRESKAKVKHDIIKLPKYLVFHIKRFDSTFHKIKALTTYDAIIDMKE